VGKRPLMYGIHSRLTAGALGVLLMTRREGSVGGPVAANGGMSNSEILRVVNRYIGVSGGYLGDFTYRTHAEFYPEYCDLDIDPNRYEGTTRQRFIKILSSLSPADQAKVLRGVLKRFPVDAGPPCRKQSYQEVLQIISRLEGTASVPLVEPRIRSELVARAIADEEALLRSSGPASAVDRIHTVLHGYIIALCYDAGIDPPNDASTTALFKLLRTSHPKIVDLGQRAQEIERMLNACGNILDAMNTLRNRASLAHPNRYLLEAEEAMLVINIGRALFNYLDAKLATGT